METIQGQELLDAVMELPGWGLESHELVRVVTFEDFVAAMAFVNRVAAVAETAGHHPDIDIRYNKVRLALVTHDAGNVITQKDLDVARKLSALLDE
ncbi:4a-hydroxytetrahydrobiopterin dehydratase [Granulicella sp. 5B5]|uniref:4a-hydroxytetrahydrobiopterin dehydratase n=1 Tax=Granulicella sp. 5B5 TaxID=1617967 RepID=UPI0015F6ED5C|nr:4a-hydroxytetrahydrobiopterin dehydratase [Granulicella sp. 5B5]QMV17492.1 4a-hydroxytetrahydrobiopterin dehydratase [Granulicella sp. 5B5]